MVPLAFLDDPTEITGLAPDASGSDVYILHDHHTQWELHAIHLPALDLETVITSSEPLSQLTIGADPHSAVALQVGTCSFQGRTRVLEWATDAVGRGTPLEDMSTTPVGWLDPETLVIAARHGCSGPVDVWVATSSGHVQQVLASVDVVSVRAAVTSFGELPNDINSDAEY